MVIDIKKSDKVMKAQRNGGTQESRYKLFLPGFFKVWFNANSRFNILSWKDMMNLFRIMADTDEDICIKVQLTNTRVIKVLG